MISVTINGADSFSNSNQRSQITSIVVVTESALPDPTTAFSLTNIGLFTASNSALSSSQILVTSVGNTYTLRFSSGSGVVTRSGSGTRGNSLADGNWVLSLSQSQISGSNQFGAQAVDRFFRMFGDGDGDGDVDGADSVAFRNSRRVGSYNSAFDWDGGGVVDSLDSTYFSSNLNKRRRWF